MAAKKTRYWLFKTEPGSYSIDDLERDGTTFWDGVRNYQARNSLRDDVQVGDEVIVYHSGPPTPGAAGLAKVVRSAYPDFTAWDAGNDHFDPKSTPDNPVWWMVDIQFVARFGRIVPLSELKAHPLLSSMTVSQRGSRLSIQPVDPSHFTLLRKLAQG